MGCSNYLLTRKHSTPVILIGLCIGIIYFAFTQYSLKLPAHKRMTDNTFVIHHMQSLDINQCIECWYQILSKTVIHKLMDTPIELHTRNTSVCPFKINDQLLQTTSTLLSLLTEHTTQVLNHIDAKKYHLSQHVTYRQLISLQRTIMIVYKYHKLYKDAYYRALLHIIHHLITHYESTQQQQKIYFNIHISKSGGTSICNTFRNLPLIPQIKTPSGAVCNYQWTHDKSSSCKDSYSRTKEYQMVARESALDVFYDSKSKDYHPKLCERFIYLLPFRHPLEKTFSWAQGDNVLKHDYRTQFYQLNDLNMSVEEEEVTLECVEQSLVLNGYRYTRMAESHHYQHFFDGLFDSENGNEKTLNSWSEVLREQLEYKRESDKLDVLLPKCMSEEQEDQHWIYVFFNKQNQVGGSFMMRYRKSQWPYPGLRLPRSSSGNTFTSWLGYGDANQWHVSAQLNPRFMIKDKHFMNACLLMLGIDHVLPFWRYLDDDNIAGKQSYLGMSDAVWNVTYIQMMKHFREKGYSDAKKRNKIDWSHVGHTSGRRGHVHSHTIALNMTQNDISTLRKNNQYDLALFRLAQWIAQVDVQLHQF
eukprot:17956_1